MDPGMSASISVAVHNLLDQLERYNLPDLVQYILQMHPDVPSEIVEIVVTTAAAWHVAKKHYTRERYMHSGQEQHQLLVDNVSNAMFRWFSGFSNRTGDRMKFSESDELLKDPRGRSRYTETKSLEMIPFYQIPNQSDLSTLSRNSESIREILDHDEI